MGWPSTRASRSSASHGRVEVVKAAWVSVAIAVAAGAATAWPSIDADAPPPATSGRVVTVSFWSQALGTRKQYLAWLPPSYDQDPTRRYPVAFYLHGMFGRETDWVRQGHIDRTLDSLVAAGMPELIVVMPDGDDGWYTTWNFLGNNATCRRARPARTEPAETYCVPWPHYDDYIARDLVAHIDGTYRTLPNRLHRGIAGLSMGGYGAVSLALTYPDVFSAAASHSGALVPGLAGGVAGVATGRFDTDALREAYGAPLWPYLALTFGRDSAGWLARDPLYTAARLLSLNRALMPQLFVTCGTEDFLLEQNRAFVAGARRMGITLAYEESAGGHTWEYWRRQAARSATWLAERLSVP